MSYKDIPTGQVLQYIKDNYLGKLVEGSRSAAGNWLQFTLEHIEKGKATLSLDVKHDMTNPYGNIHGGMMALVIDEAIGWAVVSLDTDNHYTSLNLNVDFLYAIKEGERLKATSEVIREGKKIIHVECKVYDMKGTLLGKATSNLIVTGMKPTEGNYKVAN
ncbi:MAG: PaaI family thioesterase [Bacteroidetes bacterium]|nr:PaaI family thioesterase [Bacteroidota bacterium]